jgi:mannose-1-phosphate guanylyltransferase/mannose-6-phosphate isomerase
MTPKTDRPKKIERPWGRYKEYARNEPCTVWIVEMKPGEEGSLQSHTNFDELWIMLTDGAEVQVGETILKPNAYDEVYIPRGTKHRLSNIGGGLFRMMEVAYGDVQDEDKVRYSDKYGRS